MNWGRVVSGVALLGALHAAANIPNAPRVSDGGVGADAGDADAGASDAGLPMVEQMTQEPLLGGRHWRLVTQGGVIHVWRPRGYSGRKAGTILYVHGYYTDVDGAWADHRLAKQFRDSRENALFIVPEAPNGGPQDVQFKDLPDLLATVSRLTRQKIPEGPLVAIGHSGAYRTLANWLSDEQLTEIFLLDALYTNEAEFDAWLAKSPEKRRLIVVGYETVIHCEAFCDRFPVAARRSDVPVRFSEFTRLERRAPLLYMQSQYDHMGLVTNGKVIPLLLRLTPLPRL